MGKVTLEGYECERCRHQWVKRESTEGDPIICPKCKSPYWNKPRIKANKFETQKFKKQKLKGEKFGRK